MDVCLVSHDGALLLHRTMPAAPAPFLKAVTPSREGRVVAVACMCTWYGLANLCAAQAIPLVLGHALALQAIHGGKANNDQIDAPKLAAWLRGGMRPQASVSPAAMRSTRDRWRRRTPLRRNRAARLAHVHKTHSPYNVPDIGKHIAYKAHRAGVAERFHALAVHKPIEVDLALMTYDEAWLRDWELSLVHTATQHDAHTRYVLQTVPGMGTSLRRVRLDDLHDRGRCPHGQDLASYTRLVTCSTASAGTRVGPSGQKIGHAHLTWAVAAAAPLFLRNHPHGQQRRTRLAKKHDKGKALSILAQKLGRAVYCRLTRQVVFDMELFLQTAGSRAGEPGASLDAEGMSL